MADDVRIDIVAVDKTRSAVDSAKRNMQGLEQAAQRANQTFAQVGRTAAGVFGGMAAFAAANGVANAFVGIGKTAFDAYAQSERLRQSLQAMSAKEIMQSGGANNMAKALQMAGSRAKELQGWIERLAIDSPFEATDVAQALKMGMAYGFNSREAQRLTQIMIDYASATDQSGESMQRVALALGQIRARGKLAGQEMNQLTEAGINVRQILADAFGKTTAEITSMSEKGLIGAQEAIDAITQSLERDFSGAAKEASTSMFGLANSLKDITNLRLRDLFAGVFESAQPYIVEIANTLSAPEFAAGVSALGASIGAFTTDQLGAAAGYIQQISDAMEKAPKDTPGWMTGLAALTPGQVESVLSTLTTIQTTMTELSEGDFETAWTIVANEQDPEVKEWMLWFQDETKHTVEAAINFSAAANEWAVWVQDEANREVTLAASWADDTLVSAWTFANDFFGGAPFGIASEWASTTLATAWVVARDFFAGTPLGIVGDWASTVLTGLWNDLQSFFSANPINVPTQSNSYTATDRPLGMPPNWKAPVDITQPPPTYNADPRFQAVGSGFFSGGLALVGEVGPELVSLPRGAQVLRSHDTRQVLGKIPAFAEGNTGLGDALQSLLRSMGLWRSVPQPSNMYGVQGAEVMAKAAGKPWAEAAANTENAFVEAAEKSAEATSKAVESMLQGVPGLFGTSAVTGDQMRMAEAGIPQNFADNYLRRLSDEVLNGVDWEGVDIKDAASRAGIDPNLPANMILELFRAAWDDSSLFSNPENLDLIDTGAVQDFIAKQQAQALGKANVLAYFGDPDVANTALGSLAGAIGQAANTEDNAAALRDAGYAGAAVYYSGWTSYMTGAAIVPPGTAPTGTATGVPAVPGKAVGSGYWTGGPMRVHRDETVYLPRGSSVVTAAESQRMGGGGGNVTINAQVSSNIDVEALTNQIARRLRARMN